MEQAVQRVVKGAAAVLAEELAGIALTALAQLDGLLLSWLAGCEEGLCLEVLDELARRGVVDPSPEDVLTVLEEKADRVDFDAALGMAPQGLQALILSGVVIARKLGAEKWVDRLSREALISLARRKGVEEVAALIEKYPRLSERLVEWLRSRLGG